MQQHVKIVQVLRIEKSTVITVEADSLMEAIAALASGEVDIPSASDDPGGRWTVDLCSLEHEDYVPA